MKKWFSEDQAIGLLHPRTVIETWRRECNEERPKKALAGLTPSIYAQHLTEVRLQ